MTSSKILSGSDTDNAQEWQPPNVSQPHGKGGGRERSMLTADQLEQLQKQAYEEGRKEGFEFGHKEGLIKSECKLQEWIQRLEELLTTLDTPLKVLDNQVEQELVELVISLVRQLVRREVKLDPKHIVGLVHEALAIMPVASRGIRVVLNPDDAKLIREIYDVTDKELGWKIIEDPVLARGGCRVLTETSQIDATLESRLVALFAPLLGGERGADETSQEREE
ncbi:MAG: flagellar assembly protein FliH [Sedimenticola sp.]